MPSLVIPACPPTAPARSRVDGPAPGRASVATSISPGEPPNDTGALTRLFGPSPTSRPDPTSSGAVPPTVTFDPTTSRALTAVAAASASDAVSLTLSAAVAPARVVRAAAAATPRAGS